MQLNRQTIFALMNVSILAAIIIAVIIGTVSLNTNTHYTTITVDSKAERCPGRKEEDRKCFYIVFSKDGRAFKNEDTLLYGKFNSSDLQAKLQVGGTFRLKLSGYRSGFLSSYENIIASEPVT